VGLEFDRSSVSEGIANGSIVVVLGNRVAGTIDGGELGASG
jgi:hypothetical protein